jgi:hypothetical protein
VPAATALCLLGCALGSLGFRFGNIVLFLGRASATALIGLCSELGSTFHSDSDDDDGVFYLFLQKQKIGAKLHIYL